MNASTATATRLITACAATIPPRSLLQMLRDSLAARRLDAPSRYLAEAADHADFARRELALERQPRDAGLWSH